MNEYIIGIDIGTSICKIALFNLQGKRISQSLNRVYLCTDENRFEINPEEWWNLVKSGIRHCIESSQITTKQIKGIGVSGTNALIAVDKLGQPISNAILQIDQRGIQQLKGINSQVLSRINQITGNRIDSGMFFAPKILWMKNYQREKYDKTYKFLVPTAYINYKLTGEFTMDYTRASTSMLFNIREKVWSQEILDYLGIPLEKLPTLFEPSKIIGEVNLFATKETSLRKGTPVIAGCMDTVAAALGLGVYKENIVFAILGTFGKLGFCRKNNIFNQNLMNSPFIVPDFYFSQLVISGVGSSLRWYSDNFLSGDSIFKQAIKSKLGSNGLFFVPHILGKKSPSWHKDAKGLFYGITSNSTKSDFAHSILEGIAYMFKLNIEYFEKNFFEIDKVVIGGGGVNIYWIQMLADITHKIINLPSFAETETIGAAILVGKGLNIYKNIPYACKKFNPILESIYPNEINKNKYDYLYKYFKKIEQLSLRYQN